MISPISIISTLVGIGTAGLSATILSIVKNVDASDSDWKWLIAAIVVPLGGFSTWLVKWIMHRQDTMHVENRKREEARERREEERATQNALQTTLLHDCVVTLDKINLRLEDHGKKLDRIEAKRQH